ncbi:MAG: GtrA family protein, partial [Clostridia bacterium]
MSEKIRSIKSKIKEYLKFNIIGISNFLISQIIYVVLYLSFKLHYLWAYTITSVISISASYILNSKLTFKQDTYCIK